MSLIELAVYIAGGWVHLDIPTCHHGVIVDVFTWNVTMAFSWWVHLGIPHIAMVLVWFAIRDMQAQFMTSNLTSSRTLLIPIL